MSQVMKVLELLGQRAELVERGDGWMQAVDLAGIDPSVREALRERDVPRLKELLGADHNVVCGLFPAEEHQPEQDDQQEGDGGGGEEQAPDTSERGMARRSLAGIG